MSSISGDPNYEREGRERGTEKGAQRTQGRPLPGGLLPLSHGCSAQALGVLFTGPRPPLLSRPRTNSLHNGRSAGMQSRACHPDPVLTSVPRTATRRSRGGSQTAAWVECTQVDQHPPLGPELRVHGLTAYLSSSFMYSS